MSGPIADAIRTIMQSKKPEELEKSLAKQHWVSFMREHGVTEWLPSVRAHSFLTVRLKKSLPQLLHEATEKLDFKWIHGAVGCLEDFDTNPHLHILVDAKLHKHNTIKTLKTRLKAVDVDFRYSTDGELYNKRIAYVKGIKVPDNKLHKVQIDQEYRAKHGLPQYYEFL